MKPFRILALTLLITLATPARAALPYRTEINPALRYYQAFLEGLQVPEADRQYLMTNEWRGRKLDTRFGEAVRKYDYQFRILREAAHLTLPCDWGIDLTMGPDALLPGLAPAKAVAHVTRFRVLRHLQNDRQDEARDDLLAAFALSRNLSRDGVLISALVQIAMENILASVVAENFFQWKPETLRQIIEGIDAAPARGTIAQCVPGEKLAFQDWLRKRVAQIQSDNAGNEAAMLELIHALFVRVGSEEESFDNSGDGGELADSVIKAGGGTTQGVISLIGDLGPWFERAMKLMTLRPEEFDSPMRQFASEVKSNTNPLVPKFFTIFENCRLKEFGILVELAMLRAGVEYKLHGDAGLKSVKDPFGNGPFEFRRFTFQGQDRGFKLKSNYKGRGFDEVLIFVEKDGIPFMILGKNAGK